MQCTAAADMIAIHGRCRLRRHRLGSRSVVGQVLNPARLGISINVSHQSRAKRPGLSNPGPLGLVLALCLAGSAHAAELEPKAPQTWRYVAESAEAGFDRPPLQKLALADERPEGVTETATYRGEKRRYAQLRYGTPNSNRVTIVLDQREGGGFDLYLDRNRNRTIEPKDLVEGEGPLRTAALAVEILKDDIAEHVPRRVIFRRSALDGGLSYATTGFMEGRVELAGRPIAVRRIDGDGNGFFADPRDRLWLDLDADGKWDPFSEQLPLLPVMKLADRRYALRSDAIGSRLSLEEITGVGTVRLKLATLPPETQVADLEVTLVGDDGSVYALRGGEEAVQVPVGKYALNTLWLSAQRDGDLEPWNFVFSRADGPHEGDWHAVARDADVAIDPIGTLRFVLEFPDGKGDVAAGAKISVAPRLYTQAGLLINSCSIGNADRFAGHGSGPGTDVQFVSANGAALSSGHSGFA
jgi:hypothetical protein